MIKKFLATFLAVTLTLSLSVTGTVFAANSDFAGGTGTYDDPYLIETKEQLNNVRKNLSAYYRLENDIVFDEDDYKNGGDYYNKGNFLVPIGTPYQPFSGVFDGNGKTVYNVKITLRGRAGDLPDISGSDSGWSQDINIGTGGNTAPLIVSTVGFFGYNNGVIKNLGVTNGYVYGTATNSKPMYVGGIVGYNKGVLQNCKVSANVYVGSPSKNYGGGIAGYNNGGRIENCFVSGKIYGRYYAGGIVGGISSGTIASCCSVAEAATDNYKGGIFGKNGSSMVSSCYYLNNINIGSGEGTDVGKALSSEEMKSKNSFEGFDFDFIWTMLGDAGGLHPTPALFLYSSGDINGDKTIGTDDVVVLSKLAAGWNVDVIVYAADVNGDGKVNLSDAVHLARYIAGWEGISLSQKPYYGEK